MGEWKIGYPDGLDTAANEDAGLSLYNKVFTNSIPLAPPTPKRDFFSVSSVTYNSTTGNTEIIGSGVSWGTDDFKNGTVIVRSFESANIGTGWRVSSNDATTIYVSGDVTSSITAGDYMEVHNGASTIRFNTDLSQFNPVRKEVKRGFQDKDFAMPYFDTGVVVPLGRAKEEISFLIHAVKTPSMTVKQVVDTFEAQLLKRLDYTGMNAFVSRERVAPQVLDMDGEQVLVYIKGVQPVYDPKSLGNNIVEIKVQAFIVHNK